MKLEIILNGVGSIEIEDEVNRSDKAIKKLATFALAQLREATPNGKRIGFDSAGTYGQVENASHQNPYPFEVPGVMDR